MVTSAEPDPTQNRRSIDVRRDAVAPVIVACVAIVGGSLAVGAAFGHLGAAYLLAAAFVILVLGTPWALDNPPFSRLDARWQRWRENKLTKRLPSAARRHEARLMRLGWFARNALRVCSIGLIVGLIVFLIGAVISFFGTGVIERVGVSLASGSFVFGAVVIGIVLSSSVRSPQEKLLDGHLSTAELARLLREWSWRFDSSSVP
jgi:hypothetical protein